MDANAALNNLRRLARSILARQGLSQPAMDFAEGFQRLDEGRSGGNPMTSLTRDLRDQAFELETGDEDDAEAMDLAYGFQGLDLHLDLGRMAPTDWRDSV